MTSSASALDLGLNWSGSYAEGESAAEMDAVQHSGAKYFRQQISWGYKKEHGWGPYDKVFGLAAERGMTILPYLFGRENGSPQFPEKSEYPAWETWVYEVINRYGYGGEFWVGKSYAKPVDVWEVWNEPNLKRNNPGGATVQPKLFGNFLKRTSSAIKAAQQARAPGHVGTTVVMGGLMKVVSGIGNIESFLLGVNEETGATASYDALGLHPYEFETPNHITELNGTLSFARWVLNNKVSGASKPIWVTELGWPVEYGEAGKSQQVTEAEQATLLTQAFDLIKAHASEYNIPTAIWYAYHDIPVGEWAYHSGLRRVDGTYRPSWWAFEEETGSPKWLGCGGSNPCEFTAFQANTGTMWTYAPSAGATNTTSGMAAGTNPSAVLLPSGYLMAFQGSNGTLWTYSAPNKEWVNTTSGMASGTSPSIGAMPDGTYVAAFQANDGKLWIYSPTKGWTNTTLTMATGTSPSLCVLSDGSYVAAIQAVEGNLWTYSSSSGAANRKLGMASGTSPSITAKPNGSYVVAFQANDNNLWTYLSENGWTPNTKLGMASGTSPSITSVPGGEYYVVAIHAIENYLWTYSSQTGTGTNRSLGMGTGTSPSMAPG
jgi:uncharacterized protein with FMN-binding domain